MSAELLKAIETDLREAVVSLSLSNYDTAEAAIVHALQAVSRLALAEQGIPHCRTCFCAAGDGKSEEQREEAMKLKRRNARLKAWETRRSKRKRT